MDEVVHNIVESVTSKFDNVYDPVVLKGVVKQKLDGILSKNATTVLAAKSSEVSGITEEGDE